jgi:glutamate synthase domain-containing protein 1
MIKNILPEKISSSRGKLIQQYPPTIGKKSAEEGGCGVTGFICSIPVGGKHIFEPSVQMHNRGNGKGGGIAAVGLCADDLGVPQKTLDEDYLLQVALLDPEVQGAVEEKFITPYLDVHKSEKIETVSDYREVDGLESQPPDICRYFVRVKPSVLDDFISKNGLEDMDRLHAEDEFIHQNSFGLNQTFYASLGEQKAFVLSHGRNMMILKIVGYAEQAVRYYKLDDFRAHGWIAHQRYPTKGRVWHPGGAHPFCGMDEALVHNGDFANYHSVCEYLKQSNIYPQFLTDTEVSVLLFDLWNRTYGYPLEYIIEALAPTTENDFDQLPPEKQRIYRHIQVTHIHASPDGPWFFIIARNNRYEKKFQLMGITDTAMLRPQVFALQEGELQIGLVCSEKQAIDATLHSLAAEDNRFCPIADKYWNARGGSHTDGGSFIFELDYANGNGSLPLTCTDKFGRAIKTPEGQTHYKVGERKAASKLNISDAIAEKIKAGDARGIYNDISQNIPNWDYNTIVASCSVLADCASNSDAEKATAIEALTLLYDLRYPTGDKKRSSVLHIIQNTLYEIFLDSPAITETGGRYKLIDWESRTKLKKTSSPDDVLIINTNGFPPEGDDCDSRLICAAHKLGWRNFIPFAYRGQRFTGCGLGPETSDVRIDVYGSSGDYLASGIDGIEIRVHGNAQDQLGQILKSGKLVVYGDVGQTFMYGAKGGNVFIMGNAAGRPLINAVGRPRVVINGTCLDYLAESFMAGDPLDGGGFVVLNGIAFNDDAELYELDTPYPGSNLFSLASGGAIYVRDPYQKLTEGQLNGGEFTEFTRADWKLILPYLEENERLFGISIERDLLTVGGELKTPYQVYRRVSPVKLEILTEMDSEE